MEVRPLRTTDDRTAFRSGDSDLDRFFHRFAGQNQFRHHIGTTYVAVEASTIVGYATVAPGSMSLDRLPTTEQRRLPQYPVPILRLARLAVSQDARRAGVGGTLLRFVLHLALRLRDDYGCVGVLVDAKENAVPFYSRHGFVECPLVEGAADERPAPTPMWLPIATVAAATRRSGT